MRVLRFSLCKIIKFDFLGKKSRYLIVIPRKYRLNPSIRRLQLPLFSRQNPTKSGSWCVFRCRCSACSYHFHMVEHLSKQCSQLAQRERDHVVRSSGPGLRITLFTFYSSILKLTLALLQL